MAATDPTRRCTTLGLAPSFGYGDRIGLATPGHAAAATASGAGIAAIFPQQSIREMARTGRTPDRVMADALAGADQAGWAGPIGADADHLKTPADVEATARAGFTFFTIDPSGEVEPRADTDDEPTLRERHRAIADRTDWVDAEAGRTVRLDTGTTIELDEATRLRAAVKYGRAVNFAVELAGHIRRTCDALGQGHEIELSVDETDRPTTLGEHYLIARRCHDAGVKLVSLAPRFVGDFEKGVDYKGDLAAFERSMADHAAVARLFGTYKLSLHSGSDKLSIYPILSRATRGRFHVKTAGTSYLEALRVVARCEPALFRRVVDFARSRYDIDKATYHVSATLDSAPPPSAVSDPVELERRYLGLWADVPAGRGFTGPGRQILHCTFGSTLTDPTLGPEIRGVLEHRLGTYTEVLADHFGRHLGALRAGL